MKESNENTFPSGEVSGLTIEFVQIRTSQDVLKIGAKNQAFYDTSSMLQDDDSHKIIAAIFKSDSGRAVVTSVDSIREAIAFIFDQIKQPCQVIRICVSENFVSREIAEEVFKSLSAVCNERTEVFMLPASIELVRAFSSYVFGESPSIEHVAGLFAFLAGNDLLRFFIHLPGIAHSAQDVASYLYRHSQYAGKRGMVDNPSDGVWAFIPNGTELFVIQRNPEFLEEYESDEIGAMYYKVFKEYFPISHALASKLALAYCCQHLNLFLGYAVVFDDESKTENDLSS